MLLRLFAFSFMAALLAWPLATPARAVSRAARTQTTTIPSGDLISVRLLADIGSRISVEGDTFAIQTLEDYYAKGKLALPKGTPGYGVISHIKRAGLFHSCGELTFRIKRLVAPDGTDIPVETNGATADADRGSEKNGSEVGSYLLLGVGGLFGRRGNDISIKQGTNFHVATLQTLDVPVVRYGAAPAKLDTAGLTPQR